MIFKDRSGNSVVEGDILLQSNCGGYNTGKEKYYFLKIWEMPSFCDFIQGQGANYVTTGERTLFFYSDIKNSEKININEYPKDFKYSFYHGMNSLVTNMSSGIAKELIENSDWRERIVSPKKVDELLFLKKLKIDNVADFKKNTIELKKRGYSNLDIEKITLNLMHINISDDLNLDNLIKCEKTAQTINIVKNIRRFINEN